MKDINNSDMEKMLISGKSIDELIQMKIQEDYKSLREEIKKTPKIEKITDISKVPTGLIFSKAAVYKVFNKTTRTESLINGIQAESMLGLQESVRDLLLAGKIKAFVAGDTYVEFMYVKTAQ